MTTAKQLPATPYDAEIAEANVAVSARLFYTDAESAQAVLLLLTKMQESYRRALADLAPLHRQLVGALDDIMDGIDEDVVTITYELEQRVRTALDAARKAGLS